jgi:hypothetical protein
MALSDILDRLDTDAAKRTVQDNLSTLRDLDMVHLRGHGRGARWALNENRSVS